MNKQTAGAVSYQQGLDEPFQITAGQIDSYQQNGYIKLMCSPQSFWSIIGKPSKPAFPNYRAMLCRLISATPTERHFCRS